jgi:hypothetical protein
LNGKLPDNLQDLVTANCMTESELVDSWARPYDYNVSGQSYTLVGHTGDGNPDDSMKIERVLSQAASPKSAGKTKN